MKRIMTLLLAAGLVLGSAGVSKATDVKVKGMWDFNFEWADSDFHKDNGADFTHARQRLRTQVDFIASESLKGVVFFEIGDQHWGRAAQGASIGTDGTVVEVRYSYIDWVVPETDLKVRMGLQPLALPGFVSGSSILDHDGAGITLSYDFNENVNATLLWARAENENYWDRGGDTKTHRHDALDVFGLLVPLKFDGITVVPWGMFGLAGRNSLANNGAAGHAAGNNDQIGWVRSGLLPMGASGVQSAPDDGVCWWLGLTGDVTMFDPFHFAFDVNYGSIDLDTLSLDNGNNFDVKRRGWLVSLLAEYKFDFGTPGLIFWYGSGDDDDPYDGSERLPSIRPAWKATSYGFDTGYIDTYDMMGLSAAGTAGIVGQIKNISFIDDLSHVLRVAYYRGTNDKSMADRMVIEPANNGFNGIYLTEKDDAVEVNFDTDYKIYENLLLNVSLGYIHLGFNEGTWGNTVVDSIQKNNYKGAINLRYTF